MQLGTRLECVESSSRVSGAYQDGAREFTGRRSRLAGRLSGVLKSLLGVGKVLKWICFRAAVDDCTACTLFSDPYALTRLQSSQWRGGGARLDGGSPWIWLGRSAAGALELGSIADSCKKVGSGGVPNMTPPITKLVYHVVVLLHTVRGPLGEVCVLSAVAVACWSYPCQDEKEEDITFCFDKVFYQDSEQVEVYDFLAMPIIEEMNLASSRSHCVYIFSVQQESRIDGRSKTGKVVLVDLAGSEKADRTGAGGIVLEEAKSINKSLSALGNVINALTAARANMSDAKDSMEQIIDCESLDYKSERLLEKLKQNLNEEDVDMLDELLTLEGIFFDPHSTEEIESAIEDVTIKTISALHQAVEDLKDRNDKLMMENHTLKADLTAARLALTNANTVPYASLFGKARELLISYLPSFNFPLRR
ncbi:hypothetical protein BHM03_00028031 [Ensete ventricosum]|nr:hypothetical protein BHM03_00028031 [Ensete ventricosum]